LFTGSTLSEYRNQGLTTSILSVRLNEIRARGYRYAIVEAGEMSRPIVEKHGFQYLTTARDYEWKRKTESANSLHLAFFLDLECLFFAFSQRANVAGLTPKVSCIFCGLYRS
jgi:hypothetical protein